MEEETFEVRDLRNKDKFIVDDKFLNGYAKILGATISMVYIDLCRHADKKQKAFPKQKTIGEELALSEPTVNEAIKVLEYFKLIRKKRIGKQCTNRYWLIDKKYWRKDFDVILKSLSSGDIKEFKFTTKTLLVHNLKNLSSNRKETQIEGNTNRRIKNNSDLKIAPKIKRKDFKVKPEDYKEITDAYQKYKGIELKGAEFGKVKQAIKTMLYSGRTKQNIIDFMKFCSEIDDDDKDLEWLKNWTLLTIKRKMPEFLAGKIKKKVDGEEEENYKVKFYGHTFEN